MHRREDITVIILFVTFCVVTTMRARFAAPPSPLWFTGIAATAACMFAAGWILGRRRQRSAPRQPRV